MRIAIVNDMPIAIEALRRIVLSDSEYSIAWTACDGAIAIEKCLADRPDLILMDLMMPEIDGVSAVRHIMRHSPCPILIVTASIDQQSDLVFQAMGAGAIDAINTPTYESINQNQNQLLLKKINMIKVLTRSEFNAPGISPTYVARSKQDRLIIIGSSSGGPDALAIILSQLPSNFRSSVIIIQHVDVQFAPGLAKWLNVKSALPVDVAYMGDKPQAGKVLLACGKDHLVIDQHGKLIYREHPVESVYRPSIDVFFQSVAQNWTNQVTAVLLTGMGKDGANGMLQLKNKGAYTIAQDESTSAVFGMPKAAVDLGAALKILPVEKIANELLV